MPRIPELTPKYVAAVRRLGIEPGTPRARLIARELRRLAEAENLPGPADSEAVIPPTGRAYVRRVTDENLWVWWRADGEKVRLLTMTRSPPVPIDE